MKHDVGENVDLSNLPDDFDELIARYVAKEGQLSAENAADAERLRPKYERLRSLLAKLGSLKLEPGEPKDTPVALEFFRTLRLLITELREIREASADPEFTEWAQKVLRLEQLLDPGQRFKLIAETLHKNFAPRSTPEQIEAMREAFRKLGSHQKRQARYMLRMMGTEDSFGVVVRGQVLLENTLDSCLYAYVPNPMDLFAELDMFARQKIRLAHMLGIISKAEQDILSAVNTFRNKIAHPQRRFPDRVDPDYEVTDGAARNLWSVFTHNEAVGGENWPEYDDAHRASFMRYIYLHLYLMLEHRLRGLEEKRISDISASLGYKKEERAVAPAATVVMVRILEVVDMDTVLGEGLDGA